ncbi:hypothetical protein GCM10010232_68720 [Streptomyces amakusaensis]|uniref:HPC2 multi-domain protein n=1 Tax=Streptomyces amakusaensis TaxID=67271 RepID=A0ABW0AUD8_9ACTN
MPSPKALGTRPKSPDPAVRAPQSRADTRNPGRNPGKSSRTAVSNSAVAAALTRTPEAVGGPAGVPAAARGGGSSAAAQSRVGNGAVAAAARRTAPVPSEGAVAPPAAAAAGGGTAKRPGPHADSRFMALKRDVQRKKRSVAASHPPARAEAEAAQDAAVPPKDDLQAQGKTANADRMDEARPGEFDRDAFIRAVEKAVADKAPKNLDQADKFADSGKAEEIRAEAQGKVGEGKSDSAEQIATTTAAPPDTSAAVPKEVVALSADRPPAAPAGPDPRSAVPGRLPPSAMDLSAGPARLDQDLAGARLTEPQLRRANEPSFTRALNQKRTAERHSATAPGRMRAGEAAELGEATERARELGTAAMGAMGTRRALTGQRVGAGKTGAKSRDEADRAEVTARLHTVFDVMKTDVETILSGLDAKVGTEFDTGEKAAREAFTDEHRRKMEEYKDRRYSGPAGALRWIDDKLTGLPAEADKIFDVARDGYIRRMRRVIGDVATLIGAELNRAKRRIARGRGEIRAEVKRLPARLRAIGREAAAEFTDRFDELTRTVDDKGTGLVDTLATKYTDALRSVDEEVAAEKEKNKGLVDKAAEAVKGVIDTVMELKRLLLGVLARAATAVMLILKDPVGFLRNLVSAVGAGLRLFLRNIGRHLQQGIMSWLLGRASEAGLQIPAKFDIRGILAMLAGLLGLTWPHIRARLTRRVPEEAVAAAETAVPIVAEVRRRGVDGMWDDLKNRVGDLRKDLLGKVIAYVTPTIVMAGITWILSLLNPASAFVRAVKLIIDVVTFVVTRARQIIDFVNAVLDSVIAIAKGASGAVPGLVERALARSVPVLLGFLAALVGVGGMANRVKSIVQAMSRPVNRAVDRVIDRIVDLVRRLWARIRPPAGRKGHGRGRGRGQGTGPRRPERSRPRPGARRDRRTGRREDAKGREQDSSPWWRLKKGVKPRAAPAHTLAFRGRGKSAVLVIRSQETEYRTYLDQLPAQTDPEKKTALSRARGLLTQIEGVKSGGLTNWSKQRALEPLLAELAQATLVLLGAIPLPESVPPVHGPLSNGGFGTSVTANLLTKKGLPRGTPTDSDGQQGTQWDRLKPRHERPDSEKRFYALGHILNKDLGGSGTDWINLSPQSYSGNGLFATPENTVKNLVESGKGVRYKVRVIYGRTFAKQPFHKKWKERDPSTIDKEKLRTMKRILTAENHVSVSFDWEYAVIFENGTFTKSGKNDSGSAANDIRQDPDKYHILE